MPKKELSLSQKKQFLIHAIKELMWMKLQGIAKNMHDYGDYFICNLFKNWMEKIMKNITVQNRTVSMMPYFPELAIEIDKVILSTSKDYDDKNIAIMFKYAVSGRLRLIKRVESRL